MTPSHNWTRVVSRRSGRRSKRRLPRSASLLRLASPTGDGHGSSAPPWRRQPLRSRSRSRSRADQRPGAVRTSGNDSCPPRGCRDCSAPHRAARSGAVPVHGVCRGGPILQPRCWWLLRARSREASNLDRLRRFRRIRETFGAPEFLTPADKAAWAAAGSPPLGNGTTRHLLRPERAQRRPFEPRQSADRSDGAQGRYRGPLA